MKNAERDLNQEIIRIAKEYKLNPVLLKEIVVLRARGYNNLQVATELGISAQTVATYSEKLQEMKREDFFRLIILICAIVGGITILSNISEYFKSKSKKEKNN